VTKIRHRIVADWLVHCADPLGRRAAPPRQRLRPGEILELVEQADAHGIVAALLRNWPDADQAGEHARARAVASRRHVVRVAFSSVLRGHGEALLAAARSLPVAVVKGPVFADTLYPDRSLRPFTDIDLLVEPEAAPRLAQILEEQDFVLHEQGHEHVRQEAKWAHRGNSVLMIEVHTNMVHHPDLRRAMSLTYEDLRGDAQSPAALLAIACIHGGLHRYERLQHVVDICQAARNLETVQDERQFEALIARSGARFAAVAGLQVAYRLMHEERCRDIARALGPVRGAALARLLIGRAAITSTMRSGRLYHSWRRQGFRELLKMSARPA
jgi:hypothetical protein